jgi:hypothetical protein
MIHSPIPFLVPQVYTKIIHPTSYNVIGSLMGILANSSVCNLIGVHRYLNLWIPQPFATETKVC